MHAASAIAGAIVVMVPDRGRSARVTVTAARVASGALTLRGVPCKGMVGRIEHGVQYHTEPRNALARPPARSRARLYVAAVPRGRV